MPGTSDCCFQTHQSLIEGHTFLLETQFTALPQFMFPWLSVIGEGLWCLHCSHRCAHPSVWTQPCIAWNILDSWKYVVVFWRSYGHLIYPHFTYILKSVYLLPEKSYQAFRLWVEITLNKCSCFGWLRFSDPKILHTATASAVGFVGFPSLPVHQFASSSRI